MTKHYITRSPCYKSGRKIQPQGIMLHSVGCPQSRAMVFVNIWDKPNNNACAHAIIDANNGEVIQTLPWNHRAWHCGADGNNTHISVEMCEPDCITYTSGANFVCSDLEKAKMQATTTYKSAVELFAYLCKQYNLSPDNICSHSEGHKKGIASNHADCEHIWKQLGLPYTMDGFREEVRKSITPIKELTEINDIVWELAHIGIITDKELWLKKLAEDDPAYWLARKTVNKMRGAI